MQEYFDILYKVTVSLRPHLHLLECLITTTHFFHLSSTLIRELSRISKDAEKSVGCFLRQTKLQAIVTLAYNMRDIFS